jgi:hypothetical protein
MLWAQFQPRNDAEMVAYVVGALMAGVISGAIPLSTGLAMRQPILGVIGGVVSAGAGALFGCCAGIPVALLLSGIIAVVAVAARTSQAEFAAPLADDEDLARGFQIPGSKDEPPPTGYSEVERDRRHQEKYGFRPRPRRTDDDAGSSYS